MKLSPKWSVALIATLRSSFWALDGDERDCCSGGKIEVAFKFDHGRVIVTRTFYDPKARIKM